MKFSTLMKLLTVPIFFLPIFAKEKVNGRNIRGVLCRKLHGICVGEKDTQNCTGQLEVLDCSDGEKCCKKVGLPTDTDTAVLIPRARACKQDKRCTSAGGSCISKNEHCETGNTASLCKKKCTCCIGGPNISGLITNLQSTLNSVQEEVGSIPTKIESSCRGSDSLNTTLDNNYLSVMSTLDNKFSKLAVDMDNKFSQLDVDLDNKLSQMAGDMDNKFSQLADQFLLILCKLKNYHMHFDHSCYYSSSSNKTWNDAQSDCVNKGGNLVKIDSDAEFNFIKGELFFGNTWIGLNDQQTEGVFQWISDGTNVVPAAWWQSGEPNDAGRNEDCGEINRWRMLNDATCNFFRNYICEMTL